ncbi:MAG: hypothetical protein ACJ0SL_05320 [Candidatus Rariloculaceae bacterium]
MDEIVPPTLTFKDRLTIGLGDAQVELLYTSNQTHTDDMSVIRFVDSGVIYIVDFISLQHVPGWPVGAGLLDAWLNAIRMVEVLDYDIVAPAHGVVGTRADVTDIRHYVEELRDQVASGIAAGLSVAEMQDTITMDRYRAWLRYENFHRRNIEGMNLMLTR